MSSLGVIPHISESWLGSQWTLVFLLARDKKHFLFEGKCWNSTEKLHSAIEGSPLPDVISLHQHPPAVSFY